MNGRAPIASEQAVGRLVRDAEEAWGRQDYQKSIGLIEQASRLEQALVAGHRRSESLTAADAH